MSTVRRDEMTETGGSDTAARSGQPVGSGEAPRQRQEPRLYPYRIASYVAVLACWQFVAMYFDSANTLPTPTSLASRIWEILTSQEVLTQFGHTLERAIVSLIVLYVLGVAIGILMGLSAWWEGFFRIWIVAITNLPGLLIVLMVLAVSGLSSVGPYVAVILTVFGFVTLQVWEGVKSVPQDLLAMARAFNVPRVKTLRQVFVPALAPFLFTAFIYAFTLTWKITMLTELFGASNGVGYMFRLNFSEYDVAGVMAWAVIAFVFFTLIERLVLQRMVNRFFRWRADAF